jgi:hypothetical protein
MRMKKGQTAMEYLMTYGWAILIIMVVLAVLFYLGVLNPPVPAQCSFPAGISCVSYRLSATGGNLTLFIGQGTGHIINVTGVSCSDNMTSGYIPKSINYTLGGWVAMTSGSRALVANPGSNIHVECMHASGGSDVGITNATVGSNYIGKVYLNYTEMDTGVTHTITGQFTAKYEAS